MNSFLDKIMRLLPSYQEDPDKRLFKIFIYISIATVLLMLIIGMSAFFITLKGSEQTLVPNLKGLTLENAMIELQDRGLYTKIQLRYSGEPSDKGKVLGQNYKPGTSIKVGKSLVLKVSRGAIIDRIENYIGWNYKDLEIHLKTLFTTYGPVLKIKQPVTRIFSDKPAGEIIEQKPLPDTELTGLTDIELVVSKGPSNKTIVLQDFVGSDWKFAYDKLLSLDLPFVFTSKKAEKSEKPGTVISQSPPAESSIPFGSLVQILLTEPKRIPDDLVFGVFSKTLPNYEINVNLKLVVQTPWGQRKEIFNIKHPGGLIGIPYLEEKGSKLILYVENKELYRLDLKLN